MTLPGVQIRPLGARRNESLRPYLRRGLRRVAFAGNLELCISCETTGRGSRREKRFIAFGQSSSRARTCAFFETIGRYCTGLLLQGYSSTDRSHSFVAFIQNTKDSWTVVIFECATCSIVEDIWYVAKFRLPVDLCS